MLDKYKTFLAEIYKQYQTNERLQMQYSFSDTKDKKNFYDSFDYLNECGYISTVTAASGFIVFKLTPLGLEFIENGYSDPAPISLTQGNNSIFVQGTGNSISNNYNQISIDIDNADLPDDYKELLNNFLYEMQNPKLTSEKKVDKIKQFLADFSSGTLSGVASTGLTTLLMSLFNQITF